MKCLFTPDKAKIFVWPDIVVYCCWMLPLSLRYAPSHAWRLVSVRVCAPVRAFVCECVCVCALARPLRAVFFFFGFSKDGNENNCLFWFESFSSRWRRGRCFFVLIHPGFCFMCALF